MGLLENIVTMQQETTQITPVYPENTTLTNLENAEEEGSFYILIPLGVLLGIIVLSLVVYLMASNRRRLVHIYCKKRQGRRFLYDEEYDSPLEQDPEAVEEEEDEVDNEDNPTKSLLRGKLQINNRYDNYLSTSHLNKSSEIFT